MPRRRKAQEQDDRGQDKRYQGLQQGGRFDQQQGKVRVTTETMRVQQQGSARVSGAVRDAHVGKRTVNGVGLDRNFATDDHHSDNGTKRFFTFYITNFPDHANYWYLRMGFEVCGILDDVYVAPRCNARGQRYGFVRFLKVWDVDNMVQALNNVWFGDFLVWAKVASFKWKVSGGERGCGVRAVREKNQIGRGRRRWENRWS